MENVNSEICARLFRSMLRIRLVEEEIAKVYPTDKIKSPVHLSIGQEAVAAGVCLALRDSDVVFGTYRNHGVYLAKGGDMNRMMAELYGKSSGTGHGKAGSMHLIDPRAGVLAASAIVGTSIPNAVGFGYALKLKKSDGVVATFFGDGAVDEGSFYESLNFAALEKLPVLFICENNGYAVGSRQLDRQPLANITERARVLGVTAACIPDGDVLAIYEQVSEAVASMRRDHSGPYLFECMTYRWREHVGPNEDFDGIRRNRSEADPWFSRDQISRLGALLKPEEREQISAEVESELKAATEFAERGDFPSDSELLDDVFKED